jgi:hypothetical protein
MPSAAAQAIVTRLSRRFSSLTIKSTTPRTSAISEAHGSKKDEVVAAILIRGGHVPRFPLEGFQEGAKARGGEGSADDANEERPRAVGKSRSVVLAGSRAMWLKEAEMRTASRAGTTCCRREQRRRPGRSCRGRRRRVGGGGRSHCFLVYARSGWPAVRQSGRRRCSGLRRECREQ